MEKIINLLHGIEKEANDILKDAGEEKSKIYERYQEELKKLDDAAQKATEEKLLKLRREMNEEIDNEHQVLVKTLDEELKELEQNYRKNHDKMAEEMLEKITGV